MGVSFKGQKIPPNAVAQATKAASNRYGIELRSYIVANRLSGNPIHRITGNLANSIDYSVGDRGKLYIGSHGLAYARRLELQGTSKRPAYRYIRSSIDATINKLLKYLTEALNGIKPK